MGESKSLRIPVQKDTRPFAMVDWSAPHPKEDDAEDYEITPFGVLLGTYEPYRTEEEYLND